MFLFGLDFVQSLIEEVKEKIFQKILTESALINA